MTDWDGQAAAILSLTNRHPKLPCRTPWTASSPKHCPRAVPESPGLPGYGPLPALYLGHGAPPLLEDPVWMDQLFGWAQRLPTPSGILIVSAHWGHPPLSISSTAPATPLVYDFSGFDQRFYRMTYATPDASNLGRAVTALLPRREDLHEHRTVLVIGSGFLTTACRF